MRLPTKNPEDPLLLFFIFFFGDIDPAECADEFASPLSASSPRVSVYIILCAALTCGTLERTASIGLRRRRMANEPNVNVPGSQEPLVLGPAQPQTGFHAVALVAETSRTTRDLWLETVIVLIVAVLPDLFRSIWYAYWNSYSHESYAQAMSFASFDAFAQLSPHIGVAVRSLQLIPVVLYVIWRSGEPWSAFGLARPRWLIDLPLGLAICVAGYLAYFACYLFWAVAATLASRVADLEAAVAVAQDVAKVYPAPRSWQALLVVTVAGAANGFAEELVMRAYLIPRLERLLRSTGLALLLTTALFAGYHAYQGIIGVLGAAILGLVYGAAFCWLRRLWPLAIAHALADLLATAWPHG